jgi:hypothetical protein
VKLQLLVRDVLMVNQKAMSIKTIVNVFVLMVIPEILVGYLMIADSDQITYPVKMEAKYSEKLVHANVFVEEDFLVTIVS